MTATRAGPTPTSWKKEIAEPEVQVLPLTDLQRHGNAGWCTSAVGLEDSPEVEVMCGGINTKTPRHAALWRQGNLLHFGFQEQPTELNDTGRALFENSIVYIARFEDDRPILVTPSGFVVRTYPRPRYALSKELARPAATAETLARRFGEPLRAEIGAMSAEDARSWIRANMGFIVCDADGRYAIDNDAEALGIAIDIPAFFDAALASAATDENAARALALLARRIPDGPGVDASIEAWQAFLDADRDYLFFTETGGYVWRIDPLARQRGIPTAWLRGSRRASSVTK